MATLARNRPCLWASLRAALAGYPELLSQVPDRPGPVDALPLGLPTVAARKDKRVLRQGAFAGAQEVKAWAQPAAPRSTLREEEG